MNDDYVLRRSRESDAPAIHRIRAHPATRRYQPLEQRSVEDLRQMLDERGRAEVTAWQAGKLEWVVDVNGDVAGWVTVAVTSRRHQTGTIGYSIDPRAQGRGIATRAVRKVAATALNPSGLALERLEAVAAVENAASRRVLERCGFTFEGVARGYLIISGTRVDHARYARLRTDAQGDGRTREDGARMPAPEPIAFGRLADRQYPCEEHAIREREHQIDLKERIVTWLDRWGISPKRNRRRSSGSN